MLLVMAVRVSEALALMWPAIDLQRGWLRVRFMASWATPLTGSARRSAGAWRTLWITPILAQSLHKKRSSRVRRKRLAGT